MINVGNMDITFSDQSVTLRMRHVVEGHPVCVFSFSEIDFMCEQLQAAKKGAMAKGKAAAKEPDADPFADLTADPPDPFADLL